MTTIAGRALVVGDNIDTDVILPGRYLAVRDEQELGRRAFEGFDTRVRERLKPDTILVAGSNFGCGSSREHAPVALRAAGISAIVAKSFARIFLRNAVNLGLPVVVAPSAVASTRDGSTVEIDLGKGFVAVDGLWFRVEPFPPFLQDLLLNGGLRAYVRRRLESQGPGD